jgi:hypothetical protein
MSSLTRYFENRDADLPKPRYNSGDRVFGKWNKIPFIASVVREQDGKLLVHSDLPIRQGQEICHILSMPVKDVKRLKNYDEL